MVFVAFDLETTGFGPAHERIVEIGAVKFQGQTCIAQTNWLVNPHIPIPYVALRVHGITDAMVAKAPSFPEVFRAFMDFAQAAPLVAHNARFDAGFLVAEARNAGIPFPANPILDSLVLTLLCFPEAPSHSLEVLAPWLKLEDNGHHRALEDSIYVYQLMAIMLGKLEPELTLEALTRMAGVHRPPPPPDD